MNAGAGNEPVRASIERPSRSLGKPVAAVALGIGLVLAAVVISAQTLYSYRQALRESEHRLDEIGISIVPSLAESLWQVDTGRVQLLMDGVVRLPGVTAAELVSSEGEHFRRGDLTSEAVATRSFALRHSQGAVRELGTLRVVLGAKPVFEALRERVYSIAAVIAMTLLCLSLLLLTLFRHMVTRHLAAMARHAESLSAEGLSHPMILDRPVRQVADELDRLAEAFNHMQETLRLEFSLRKQHEAELIAHRARLEDVVFQRTEELARKNIELQLQNDAIETLANTDSLTGTANRRMLITLAEHQIARAHREGETCSLVLLDVDHFKRVNDLYGHAFGDKVLKTLSATCREQLRAVDLLARWGGEEFAILLPGTDRANALLVAERIRTALEFVRYRSPLGDDVRVTASLGVASLSADISLDKLVRTADTALYRAKDEGRNRVC